MKKKTKRCTGLLPNCSLNMGHESYCVFAPRRGADRASPCVGKCKHRWCDGYNAGYGDGQIDERMFPE